MPSAITISPYKAQHAGGTIEVFLRAITEVAAQDYTPAQVHAWAQVPDPEAWAQKRLSRPAWVALCEHEVIGFIDLTATGYLDMLFVHPAHQRSGVATRLYTALETFARAQGMVQIETEASITARPFFERQGFVVICAQSVVSRGQTFINYRMSKAITDMKKALGVCES